MRTPLFAALIACILLYSCAKDSENQSKGIQYVSFEMLVEESEDYHTHSFFLKPENAASISIPEHLGEEILEIAEAGSILTIESNDINNFLRQENFELSKIKTVNKPQLESRSGNKRLLAIIVNTDTHPCFTTIEELENNLFNTNIQSGSLQAFFNLQSQDDVSFVGDVVEIDIELKNINLNTLREACSDAIQEQGFNYEQYEHVSFFTDKTQSYQGIAFINGKWSHIDNSRSRRVIIHEIGHNLGMHHSQRIQSNGSILEYGDRSCSMGGTFSELNALQRVKMDWIPNANKTIITNNAKEIPLYSLEYEDLSPGQFQAIQIKDQERPYTLTVSKRTNFNVFDSDIPQIFREKISIHTSSSYNRTLLLTTLSLGESYFSPEINKTITFASIDQNRTAYLNIQ